MLRFVLSFLVFFSFTVQQGNAQQANQVVWVQIEAHPDLQTAAQRIEGFSRALPDVAGFAMEGGWFAITLGPYTPADAEDVLRSYRAQGLIPTDSYVALSRTYRQQYWPPGQDILSLGELTTQGLDLADSTPVVSSTQETAGLPDPIEIDETPAQARRSESLLNRAERRELQTALKWAGFYNSAIDGAFGRGTRSSMGAWQTSNGFERTGILTSAQRTVLLGQYNAILDGLDMALVQDVEAGIDIKMPTALVEFSRYESPFAHYDAKQGGPARVLLISQSGDRATLKSLFDIMQTLTIVPLNGPRQLSRNSFSLVGQNADFISQTEVSLDAGTLKGFTLIWPTGDEARRTRVLEEMQESFTRQTGVINPNAGLSNNQQVDLVAGLEIRKPRLSRSGFFVDASGAVVTTVGAVQSCARITLDDTYEATVTGVDMNIGLALLTPNETLSPPAIARFSPALPRLQSEVAATGYSFEGQLTAPSITFGTLAEHKSLQGDRNISRLSLDTLPGDIGGPVFDSAGNVFGMLLPAPTGSRALPKAVRFVLTGEAITGVLKTAGLNTREGDLTTNLDPVDITERGVGMTVLVRCWD
ncbi:MAG: serine protease [Roseobacter sp.]